MSTPALHSNLAQGRWFTMTLPEQLGNIGSEYERAWSWKIKNNPTYFEKAFKRMLELLDLTITDPRWQNHRLKELVRLREVACQLQDFAEKTPEPLADLRKYFLQFATLARRK
jgi:hypothetical protein